MILIGLSTSVSPFRGTAGIIPAVNYKIGSPWKIEETGSRIYGRWFVFVRTGFSRSRGAHSLLQMGGSVERECYALVNLLSDI